MSDIDWESLVRNANPDHGEKPVTYEFGDGERVFYNSDEDGGPYN